MFVRAMAELWKELGYASKWGDPRQIDRKLGKFVGLYAAIPEPVAGFRAASHHELGLGIATRVAVAGANAAKGAALLERGITSESLMNSGNTDVVEAMMFDEARSGGFDTDSLTRNWEAVRQAVRKIAKVSDFDVMALSACIRDESVRAGRSAVPKSIDVVQTRMTATDATVIRRDIVTLKDFALPRPHSIRLMVAQFDTGGADWECRNGLFYLRDVTRVRKTIEELLTVAKQKNVGAIILPELSVPVECIELFQNLVKRDLRRGGRWEPLSSCRRIKCRSLSSRHWWRSAFH